MALNRRYVTLFVLAQFLAGVMVGYCLDYSNQAEYVFDAKFHRTTEDARSEANSLVGTSITLGLTLGSIVAGPMLRIGRRNTILISCILAMAGIGTTYVENFKVILGGRVIFGFASGLQGVACPRFIEETIPSRMLEPMITLFYLA